MGGRDYVQRLVPRSLGMRKGNSPGASCWGLVSRSINAEKLEGRAHGGDDDRCCDTIADVWLETKLPGNGSTGEIPRAPGRTVLYPNVSQPLSLPHPARATLLDGLKEISLYILIITPT